jgi:magnesium-transporting ATPase (P-type)
MENKDFWMLCYQPIETKNPVEDFKIKYIDMEKVPVSRSFNRKFIWSVLRAILVLAAILGLLSFLIYRASYSKTSFQLTSIVALYPTFMAMKLFFFMVTEEQFWKVEYEYIEVVRNEES